MAATIGVRERRRRDTRGRIERAALALFADRGYAGTRVVDIALAAGVSPRTVFRHFPRKRDLIFADAPDHLALLTGALADAPPQPSGLAVARSAALVLAAALEGEVPSTRSLVVRGDPTLTAWALQVREGWSTALAGVLAGRPECAGMPAGAVRMLAGGTMLCLWEAVVRWSEEGAGSLATATEGVFAETGALFTPPTS